MLAEASATTGRGRQEVLTGLLGLVTADEQGRPTRWRVPRSELSVSVRRGVDVFVTRRLLSTDLESGSVVVGVAHEAILTAWEPLAQAIEANVSTLRARRAVEQAAADWDEQSRPPPRLWERGQLAAALADTGAHLHGSELLSGDVQGRTLATSAADTTARLWETNLDNATARICRTTPAVTKSEWDRYLPGLAYRARAHELSD